MFNQENVILQGGSFKCPICRNTIKWSYKLDLITGLQLDPLFKTPSQIKASPFNCINHIVTSNGSVRFNIYCANCGYVIETEPMKLVNKENYENNKEN